VWLEDPLVFTAIKRNQHPPVRLLDRDRICREFFDKLLIPIVHEGPSHVLSLCETLRTGAMIPDIGGIRGGTGCPSRRNLPNREEQGLKVQAFSALT